MLEKPAILEEAIIACIQDDYDLTVDELTFLPLGADVHTAVYRVVTKEQKAFFLKLRSGRFKEISITLPQFLHGQGIKELIPLYPTKKGTLWSDLAEYKVMLYPFIAGHDAFEVHLTESQWRRFGTALKWVHTAVLPLSLTVSIPQETYSPQWRSLVEQFMQCIQRDSFTDPVARQMAAFLNEKQADVARLLRRTEQLAQIIQYQPQACVLCHSDIHAWNLLVGPDGSLYIVDWDDPILAPKERDLMFVGSGIGNIWKTSQEEAHFYEGYGPAEIDQTLMAYYRCERIIQDIAAYCEQIFLSDEGGADRAEALRQLTSNFLPGRTIDIALKTGFFRF